MSFCRDVNGSNVAFDPFDIFPSSLQLWVVGGAVRDLVLMRKPRDWDFVVDMDIEEIRGLTGGSLVGPAGKQVCVFSKSGRIIEVAPMVGGSILADLARRDFTMNAMALSREWNLLDPFGGREDTSMGMIRFVPDLDDRLIDDPIRAVRLCRFSATLNLATTEKDLERVRSFVMGNRAAMDGIHPQRLGKEMMKGLAFPRVFLRLLRRSGLVESIFPVLGAVGSMSFPDGPLDPTISLALLLRFCSEKDRSELLVSWGISKAVKKEVLRLAWALSAMSRPICLDDLCDLIARLGTSWISRLRPIVYWGFAGDGFIPVMVELERAAIKLSEAERVGIPLSGGSIASEIGPGPDVKPCLWELVRYVLSEDKPSIEGARAIIYHYL